MAQDQNILDEVVQSEYKYGFTTDIEQELLPKGLDESVIRFISAKKNEPEWLLEWRLHAFEQWKRMIEPTWPNVKYPKIDFQDIIYWAAP
ncbi:MAG: Fe-S cluster assembly protein SufB, partial [Ignavibacteria bacterium]